MEIWFLVLVTISISLLLKAFFNLLCSNSTKLPPGPTTFPIIGNTLWLRNSFYQIEPILRDLQSKFGPIVTVHFGSHPAIYVSDRSLAHQALVQSGSLFSCRPKAGLAAEIMSCNQHSINSASYGPNWRLFRRNLTSEILHPSRLKSYSHAQKSALHILFDGLQSKAKNGESVQVLSHFQYAMFCLLGLMCFGDQLSEVQIKEIQTVIRNSILNFFRSNKLNFLPKVITKLILPKEWENLYQIRKDLDNVLIPLIRARKKAKIEKKDNDVLAYVDTLLDLELPEEKRKLNEGEIVSLSSEFLSAGTDTTSTALQWIMANLVK